MKTVSTLLPVLCLLLLLLLGLAKATPDSEAYAYKYKLPGGYAYTYSPFVYPAVGAVPVAPVTYQQYQPQYQPQYQYQQQQQQQQEQQQDEYSSGTGHNQAPARSQYFLQDEAGQYSFGYASPDGSFRQELRNNDGSVSGTYGYLNQDGHQVSLTYTAGQDGFQQKPSDGQEGHGDQEGVTTEAPPHDGEDHHDFSTMHPPYDTTEEASNGEKDGEGVDDDKTHQQDKPPGVVLPVSPVTYFHYGFPVAQVGGGDKDSSSSKTKWGPSVYYQQQHPFGSVFSTMHQQGGDKSSTPFTYATPFFVKGQQSSPSSSSSSSSASASGSGKTSSTNFYSQPFYVTSTKMDEMHNQHQPQQLPFHYYYFPQMNQADSSSDSVKFNPFYAYNSASHDDSSKTQSSSSSSSSLNAKIPFLYYTLPSPPLHNALDSTKIPLFHYTYPSYKPAAAASATVTGTKIDATNKTPFVYLHPYKYDPTMTISSSPPVASYLPHYTASYKSPANPHYFFQYGY